MVKTYCTENFLSSDDAVEERGEREREIWFKKRYCLDVKDLLPVCNVLHPFFLNTFKIILKTCTCIAYNVKYHSFQ